jgi:hypothetical protein
VLGGALLERADSSIQRTFLFGDRLGNFLQFLISALEIVIILLSVRSCIDVVDLSRGALYMVPGCVVVSLDHSI